MFHTSAFSPGVKYKMKARIAQELVTLCALVTTITIDDVPTRVRLLPRGCCIGCCPRDEQRDIIFELYTVSNPDIPDRLVPGNDMLLERSHIDSRNPTVVYVHGFTENNQGASSVAMRRAYLRRGGWNIILVDYTSLSSFPHYEVSTRNVDYVADYLTKLLVFLNRRGILYQSMHLIGFSLGAHVVGVAGNHLNGILPRITGLDPAFPLFAEQDKTKRLDADDAQFVDVIHSDGGAFGFPTPIGHADFFPNGGIPIQPGCELPTEITREENGVYLFLVCSHQRAWRYYVESLSNECGFLSSTCLLWLIGKPDHCRSKHGLANMGFAVDKRVRGSYYLTTNRMSPFAKTFGCPSTAT